MNRYDNFETFTLPVNNYDKIGMDEEVNLELLPMEEDIKDEWSAYQVTKNNSKPVVKRVEDGTKIQKRSSKVKPGKQPKVPDEELTEKQLLARNNRRKRNREAATRARKLRVDDMTRLQNDQSRLRSENAEIEDEINELKRKIHKYTTMWKNLPKQQKAKPQDTLIVKPTIVKQEVHQPTFKKSAEALTIRPPNALDLLIGSPSSSSTFSSVSSSEFTLDQEMYVPKPAAGPPSPQLPLEVLQTIEDLQNDKQFNTPIQKPKKSAFFSAL